MVSDNIFWRLREDCRMRRERFGVLVYLPGGNCMDLAAPAVAMALAMLNGQRSVQQSAEAIEQRLQLEPGEGAELIEAVVGRYRGFMTALARPSPEPAPGPDPEAFFYHAPLWHAGVEATDHRLSAPIALTWIATRRCNFRCTYCYVDSGPSVAAGGEDLPPMRLRERLDEAAQLGVASLMVTGGEPLLVDGVEGVIRHAIDLGIAVDLNSNGTLLAAEGQARRLAACGIDDIVISIDSASPQLHARICGATQRSHGQVLEGIRQCLGQGIKVKTNTLLCAQTIPQLDALIELLAGLGVREMLFSHYVGSFYNRRDALFPSLAAYRTAHEILHRARARHPDLSLECPELERTIECLQRGESPGISRCDGLKRGLIIFPDGRVSFCDTLQGTGKDDEFMIGNLNTQSIAEVWDDPRFRQLLAPCRERFAGTACAQCRSFETCMAEGHCYSRAMIRFGSGFAPDPFCPAVYPGAQRMI